MDSVTSIKSLLKTYFYKLSFVSCCLLTDLHFYLGFFSNIFCTVYCSVRFLNVLLLFYPPHFTALLYPVVIIIFTCTLYSISSTYLFISYFTPCSLTILFYVIHFTLIKYNFI